MASGCLFWNGVDATTGAYLRRPLPLAEPARRVPRDGTRPPRRSRGVRDGVDVLDLAQAGWGVVFAAGTPQAVRDALAPLLAQRRSQAATRFRDELALQPGEGAAQFLLRHGVAHGPVDPDRMPYYLLLVGDPEAIPYAVQQQLDVQHAVGRVCFDSPAEYARYAAGVVVAEGRPRPASRRAVLFAPRHSGDPATELTERLVFALTDRLQQGRAGWSVEEVTADDATKPRLARLLGGGETPDLLFTAGHGIGFPPGDPRQLERQGGLLCQEWPGPLAGHGRPIPAGCYLAAGDVDEDADLTGLIAFHFACYSAGTPRLDSYAPLLEGGERQSAPRDFVARLPQRLLGLPKGALAAIGHVDTAWQYPFDWPGAGLQLQTFESVLSQLMAGRPVGLATEFFGQRHGEIAADLVSRLPTGGMPERTSDPGLTLLWLAHHDARSYVLLGDPAARLGGWAPPRPTPAAPGQRTWNPR
jgi:hypothetical protein